MLGHINTAVAAAIDAGQAILDIYHSGDFDVTVKGDDSPLTRADVAAHEVIVRHLIPTGIPVLSEEGRNIPFEERKAWRELWVVDPIDGTKEFIKRNGEFTVNIALIRDGHPVLGVIYVPVTGELYVGEDGQGAVKSVHSSGGAADVDSVLNGAVPIPMDKGDRPFTAVASRSHMSPETEAFVAELRKVHGEVALISKGSSLKLCMVAEGKADCYPRFAPTMEWDTAAGQAICMAAGFDVVDQNTGKTMQYNRKDLLNAWFLVQ